jgi:two-component system, NtrC family, nitrogen regulation sensor histidine kinase NtrY
VTLAMRLMLAIGLSAMVTTLTLGIAVREAWRGTEERRFEEAFRAGAGRLQAELERGLEALPSLVDPLCAHDPVIDGVLVDLRSGRLDAGRRLAIGLRVPELMRALRLDELTLVTLDGEILGAGHDPARVGVVDAELARRLRGDPAQALARPEPTPAIEAHCLRRLGAHGVGLVGARHLSSLLDDVRGEADIRFRLAEAPPRDDVMTRAVLLPQMPEVAIVALRSRTPLERALTELDETLLGLGVGTLTLALLVVWLIARGLARPIVALSAEARRVVSGDLSPVRGRGGRELVELAASFNQALADLASLRKRLATTERIAARREIARRVAHEIKNPLMPIRAAVETLRRLRARGDPAFDAYFDEASRTVLDEVSRITRIVQEFTDFARLPPPEPEALDVVALVEGVVALHRSLGAHIDIRAEALPAVHSDRDQLVQVATNLLQNALDATRDLPDPRIVVELASAGTAHVTLSVRDNGPGVSAEQREHLFEPYATTKAGGTGLGLAIAQRIAIEHGGDLEYRPAPEGGAEFRLTLPISGPTLLHAPPTSEP